MRKFLAVLLCLLMILSMAACNKDNKNGPTENPTDSTKQQNNADDTKTPTQLTEPTNETVDSDKNKATKNGDVVYEDDRIKLVFNEWDFRADERTMFVKMEVTNKTDVELSLESDDEFINSWSLLSISGRATVDPLATTNFNLMCMSDCFDSTNLNSLEDIKELSFVLTINKNDDRTYAEISLYPSEDREYDFFDYEPKETDVMLIDYETDEGKLQLIYTGNYVYSDDVVYLEYYCINTFDRSMNLQFDGIKIGNKNYGATPSMQEILPNKELISSCSVWADEDVVSNNDTIKFQVTLLDTENTAYVVETDVFEMGINKGVDG